MLKRILTLATHRIYSLPILVLMPHSRCNCRCVMCDIWKANHEKKEIAAEVLEKHVGAFRKLGVREVVFSGGEALMHSNLWKLTSLLTNNGMKITLLSTGLLLEKHAQHIVDHLDGVIVSLDGSQQVHDRIRNIPQAFEKLAAGIQKLRQLKEDFKISARCVIQKYNFRDFVNTVRAAKDLGVDQISFLAADVSSSAFNHDDNQTEERISGIALSQAETVEFEQILEQSFFELKDDYRSGWIAENPQKMRKIAGYYKAINGLAGFPGTVCNAPWVSAVLESDGRVMPCFFHKPYGNIYTEGFLKIINSPRAINFRRNLDVNKDPTCKKCVCSLKLGITQPS